MTDLRKAAEMALEALEWVTQDNESYNTLSDGWDLVHKKINLLRQALAQPEQEPVAWMASDNRDMVYASEFDKSPGGRWDTPLYTAPPKQPVKSYCGGKPNYCTEPESTKWEPAIAHNYNPDGTLQSINVKLTPQSGWVDYEPLKREWVGLTDEEMIELGKAYYTRPGDLMFAVEAKLKEKNS